MIPPTFRCRHCGGDTYVEPDDWSAICADCCGKRDEHEFEYERAERARFCVHCNEQAPDDYYGSEDDVPISFIDPGRPLGTPISKLSGRPGEPGYAEFCRIAKSWGHD